MQEKQTNGEKIQQRCDFWQFQVIIWVQKQQNSKTKPEKHHNTKNDLFQKLSKLSLKY